MDTHTHLTRVRSGVRAVLALGVAASVAANVLHAQPTLVGRAIAAWSPLALLLTVELISRVPVYRPALSGLRMAATASIAGIAAWVSYWHMAEVAARNGESATSAHLLPLSVDGLVVVASVSLVEITARLRSMTAPLTAATETGTVPVALADDADAADPGPVTTAEPETAVPVRETAEDQARPVKAGKRPVPTGVRVARLRTRYPAWTVAQIAERAGISERTARRHLNQHPASTTATPDGTTTSTASTTATDGLAA